MGSEGQLVFIDFEFSMPERHKVPKDFHPEIIEAGVVVVNGGKVIDTFSCYIKPVSFPRLTNRCKRFLSITQADVDGGRTFNEMHDYFTSLDQSGVKEVVTWGNMDMKVLRDSCARVGMAFPFHARFVDLSMEYKRFFGDQNQTGLWKAVQEYGREGVGKHHKALDDAMTTQHIYHLVEKDKKYLEKAEPTTIGDRIDLSKFYNQLA